jgi:hypothetical protein
MPDQKMDAIVHVLDELLNQEEVFAAMVKARGVPAISPPVTRFKIKNFTIWQLINSTIEQSLSIIDSFYQAGADKLYLEVSEYVIGFFVIDRGSVLVVVIPELANRGFLEVEFENIRRELRGIFKQG